MNITEVSKMIQLPLSVRVLLSVLPCLPFFYINSVMVVALLRKPFLLESPHYILFGHLLFTDSLKLLMMMLLYLFSLTMIRMVIYVCVVITHLGAIATKLSPINLAVMSVERYISICLPLRHATIVTPRKTVIAIAVMWSVASLESFMQLFLFLSLDRAGLTSQGFCNSNRVFRLQIHLTLNRAITATNFVLVTIIIIYTYAAIMISVKRPSSCARKARSEHKTVLLHVFQLFLYLISTLFNMINSTELLNLNAAVAIHIQNFLFLCLLVIPKCLSSLIYGLKDQAIRQDFKYYLCFGYKYTIRPHP